MFYLLQTEPDAALNTKMSFICATNGAKLHVLNDKTREKQIILTFQELKQQVFGVFAPQVI